MTRRIAISGTEYPHRPLHEVLDVADRLKVKFLELWIPHNFRLEELSAVERELRRRGLQAAVISTWTQLNLPGEIGPRQELIKESIEAAKALGARSVNTYFGGHPGRAPDEAIRAYAEAIAPCLEKADAAGVYVTLENEFEPTGTDITRKADQLRALVDKIGSPVFKLNFDPCNFYFAGEEPYPYAYRLLKDSIGYVHVKNGTKFSPALYKPPAEGFLWKDLSGEYICCHLEKGALPLERLLQEIALSGYDGFLGLEPHVPPAELAEAFTESLSFIQRCLARVSPGEP